MFAGLDESGPPYGGWIQMTDVTNLSFAYPIALNPNGGYVGVGTYTPQVELTVAGDIRAGISGTNGCLQNFAGTAIAGTCSSDAALKNVVGDVSDILERFGKLQLVHFRWNTTAGAVYHNSASVLNTGFIAQSVEQQFPELVTFDAHRFRQLDYTSLNLYGLEAIKELKSVVDKQASQIARQSTEIAALKNLLSRSDERLSSLEGRLQNISTANASGRQKILSSAKL
jgi:hypothetical protein